MSCLPCPPFRHRANSQPPDRSPSVPTGQLTFKWPKSPTGSIPCLEEWVQERRGQARGWERTPGLPSPSPSPSSLPLTVPSAPFLPSQLTVSQALTFHSHSLFLLNYFPFYLPGTLEFTKCFYIYRGIESTPGRDGETLKIPSNCQVFLLKMQTSPEEQQLGWQPPVPQD